MTEAHVQTLRRLEREARKAANLAARDRAAEQCIARGEPDPRIIPTCTCPIECEEVPGCVESCECRCEAAIIGPDGRIVGGRLLEDWFGDHVGALATVRM